MNIPSEVLPTGLMLTSHLALVTLGVVAVRQAPWRALTANSMQHVLGGALVSLLLLWSFRAGVTPGLGYHFLGVTVLTLMFGWSLATLAVITLGLGLAVSGKLDWYELSLTMLLTGVLPVTISYLIQRWVTRRLPTNPFVYIFVCGFFGAIFAALVTVLAVVGVLVLLDAYSFSRIAREYLPFLPLYLFPEGLMNGMLTAVFVGLKPEWLRTFDEARYFRS